MKEWYFFKDGFMDWMKEEFSAVCETHFVCDLIDNLIEYGLKVTETPNDFIGMMMNIVPEVTYEEWMEWINK